MSGTSYGGRSAAGDIPFSIAVFLIALLPRLFVAIAWSKEPVWDGHYYHFGAERIAQGLGYSEDVWSQGQLVWKPWVHYPVGYSALLAIPYAVFGSGLLIAPLLSALSGALLALVTHRFARYFLSEQRARIAGGLVALHPGLIVYSALVMTELVAALFLLLAGLLVVSQRRDGGAAGGGALLGIAALIRPASLLALPLLLLADRERMGRAVRTTLIATVCTFAVLLPWTVRNCRTLDGCALISTNGGWNLAIGAITETGRFQTLKASDGCAVVTGQVQQDRCWARVGMQKIADDPLAWLSRAPKKLAETFNHESFAIEYLHEADPVSWTESRRAAGRALLGNVHRLLLAAAVFGLLAWPRPRQRLSDPVAFWTQAGLWVVASALPCLAFLSDDHPFHWLVVFIALVSMLPLPGRIPLGYAGRYAVGLLVTLVATHILFFGEDRYHLVAVPVLCMLAARALQKPDPVTDAAVTDLVAPPPPSRTAQSIPSTRL